MLQFLILQNIESFIILFYFKFFFYLAEAWKQDSLIQLGMKYLKCLKVQVLVWDQLLTIHKYGGTDPRSAVIF